MPLFGPGEGANHNPRKCRRRLLRGRRGCKELNCKWYTEGEGDGYGAGHAAGAAGKAAAVAQARAEGFAQGQASQATQPQDTGG